MNRMRAHFLAMFTFTETQLVHISLIIGVIIILNYFNYSIQSFLKWLPKLSETSLQVYTVLLWAQCSAHKNGRHLSTIGMFSYPISIHRICIYPKYVSQPLNVSGLLILQEVSDKQAFPFALHKMIMTLS